MVKIERSLLAPPSLAIDAKKANGSCTQQDVIDQLKHDFHDKCYICELSNLSDPNVEHLLPHTRMDIILSESLTGTICSGPVRIATTSKVSASMMKVFWIAAKSIRKN